MELEKPELVFGLVGAVGVSLGFFGSTLEEVLEKRGYVVEVIQLSDFLRGLNLKTLLPPDGASEYLRLTRLMDRGDEFRRIAGGEALALLAASHINSQRPEDQPRQLPARAFVIRQLKHPDEVEWLRRIYGPLFHLLGLYSPKVKREHHLRVVRGLSQSEVTDVINRDEGEPARWGQQLRSTFHLADAFIEFSGDYAETEQLHRKLDRFLRLLFGDGVLTPSKDEFGMSLAHTAALRSGDLSRQVGSAILSPRGEVLAVGMNDVPRSGGGLYWEGDADDCRDLIKGFDSNETMKRNILEEVLSEVLPDWEKLTEAERTTKIKDVALKLDAARIMNLTEFGRAVHAEMEAITGAARMGIPIDGTTLYTTTFPCHNCAKHIVAAGIRRVVYIEPYPKSLALDLHSDSIALDEVEHEDVGNKVRFEPFVGIAPRRYEDLFSTVTQEGKRLRRKTADGTVRQEPLGIRMQASPLSYIERESAAALLAAKFGNLAVKEG